MALAVVTSSRNVRLRAAKHAVWSRSGRAMAWALMLSLMLLFSQFLSLSHGIAHAGWGPAAGRPAHAASPVSSFASSLAFSLASFNAALFNYVDDDADGQPGKGKHHHSCIEYDAASGAIGIHAGFFTPPLMPGVQVLALWQAFVSLDAPVFCHFSSRAPPR
jgi:hypothetical protein